MYCRKVLFPALMLPSTQKVNMAGVATEGRAGPPAAAAAAAAAAAVACAQAPLLKWVVM
jgi:hypothetical protein